jgi:hypothetical protein
MKSAFRLLMLATVLLSGTAQQGRAGGISSLTGVNGLGAFDGTLDYVAADSLSATLTITLNNLTPSELGGILTGFAFNNPGNLITDVSLTSGNANFGILGGLLYQNGIAASPYGDFDIGVSSSATFDGDSTNGIASGDSETFEFDLSGNSLDTLSADNFFAELSNSPGAGGSHALIARFRGFDNDGTDTVPGGLFFDPPAPKDPPEEEDNPPPPPPPDNPGTPGTLATPEPTSLTLAGIALSCFFARARLRRRRPAADLAS